MRAPALAGRVARRLARLTAVQLGSSRQRSWGGLALVAHSSWSATRFSLGFRVWGLGFGVWGLGFGVWGLGFGVWGLGFWGLGFRV